MKFNDLLTLSQQAALTPQELADYDANSKALITQFNAANPQGKTVTFKIDSIRMNRDQTKVFFVCYNNGQAPDGNYTFGFTPLAMSNIMLAAGLPNWQIAHALNANSIDAATVSITYIGRIKGATYADKATGDTRVYKSSALANENVAFSLPNSAKTAIMGSLTSALGTQMLTATMGAGSPSVPSIPPATTVAVSANDADTNVNDKP